MAIAQDLLALGVSRETYEIMLAQRKAGEEATIQEEKALIVEYKRKQAAESLSSLYEAQLKVLQDQQKYLSGTALIDNLAKQKTIIVNKINEEQVIAKIERYEADNYTA